LNIAAKVDRIDSISACPLILCLCFLHHLIFVF